MVEAAGERNLPIFFHTGTPVTCMPYQLADLAERYPAIRFIMGHSATTDFWNDVIEAVGHLPNVFYDTSLHNPGTIAQILKSVGPDRIIFSSDLPENPYGLEIEKVKMAVPDAGDQEKVFRNNILGVVAQ